MSTLARLLRDTSHGAFPVVREGSSSSSLEGTVGRPELTLALLRLPKREEGERRPPPEPVKPRMSFQNITEFIDSRKTKENSKEIRLEC